MKGNIDIHDRVKRCNGAINNFNNTEGISSENKKIVGEFINFCFSEGLSHARVEKYVCLLKSICLNISKQLPDITKDDIQELILKLQQKYDNEMTLRDFRICLKKFYKWLRKTEENPPEVRWLKSTIKKNKVKLPEELLTEDEIRKMLELAPSARDKCLISLLFESGARIGEIGSLKIKHVVIEDQLCKIMLFGKTGARRIPVLFSRPYIVQWLEVHPLKKDPEAPLFVMNNVHCKAMTYAAIRKLVKVSAQRADIKKRIHCHLFRHSRATILASHFTESQMKQFLGWTMDSNMASTYVHMNGKELDSAVMGLNGIQLQKEKTNGILLSPQKCLVCNAQNPATSNFCAVCGNPLSQEKAVSLQQKLETREQEDKIILLALKHGMEQLFQKIQKLEKQN